MSVVEVKIKIGDVVKTMRFPPETRISAVCKQITDNNTLGVGPDHALFRPATGDGCHPKWILQDKTLQFYDLQSGTLLEFRTKHRTRKVKLLDETIKTILLDETTTVQDCVEAIASKIGITNPEEFSLQKEGSGDWLNSHAILGEIGLADDDMVVLKKKFFFSDANIDRTDLVQVHMLYIQCRDSIMGGQFPATKEEAKDLAALQAQITFGDYVADRKTDLKQFLPQYWQNKKGLKKGIREEHHKLAGMTDFNAKYRYIQLCRSLKTYGSTLFQAKILNSISIKSTKVRDILFGVTRESCLILDPDTKETLETYKLTHIKRWAAADKALTLDFGEYAHEYLTISTPEGEQITQLIAGYIDIILKAKTDPADGRASIKIATTQKVPTPRTGKGITATAVGMLGRLMNPLYSSTISVAQQKAGAAHVPPSQKVAITDLQSAAHATELLIVEMDNAARTPRRPSGQVPSSALSPEEFKKQLVAKSALAATMAKGILDDFIQPPLGGMTTLHHTLASTCQQLFSCVSVVGTSSQNALYVDGVSDQAMEILDAGTKLAKSIHLLLKSAVSAVDGSEEAKISLTKAIFEAHAAGLLMAASCDLPSPLSNNENDRGSKRPAKEPPTKEVPTKKAPAKETAKEIPAKEVSTKVTQAIPQIPSKEAALVKEVLAKVAPKEAKGVPAKKPPPPKAKASPSATAPISPKPPALPARPLHSHSPRSSPRTLRVSHSPRITHSPRISRGSPKAGPSKKEAPRKPLPEKPELKKPAPKPIISMNAPEKPAAKPATRTAPTPALKPSIKIRQF